MESAHDEAEDRDEASVGNARACCELLHELADEHANQHEEREVLVRCIVAAMGYLLRVACSGHLLPIRACLEPSGPSPLFLYLSRTPTSIAYRLKMERLALQPAPLQQPPNHLSLHLSNNGLLVLPTDVRQHRLKGVPLPVPHALTPQLRAHHFPVLAARRSGPIYNCSVSETLSRNLSQARHRHSLIVVIYSCM